MRVLVLGSGMAGLTAARALTDAGREVVVLDKGRRPGGRMATAHLAGGARADHGAQFFTVRSPEFGALVDVWVAEDLVVEWCRGFGTDDGHPRFVVPGGMAGLPGALAGGLDVRQSTHVGSLRPVDGGWEATWPTAHGRPGGSLRADAVVVTSPVPQSAALLAEVAQLPAIAYDATLSLVVALDGPSSVPTPGGVQPVGDPVWSWVGDNRAKGVSSSTTVTLHTTAEVAAARWDEAPDVVATELLEAARPWLGGTRVVASRLHRWRYATPVDVVAERSLEVAPGLVLAGDAFGGPRVEGAFLSGLDAANRITGARPRP